MVKPITPTEAKANKTKMVERIDDDPEFEEIVILEPEDKTVPSSS